MKLHLRSWGCLLGTAALILSSCLAMGQGRLSRPPRPQATRASAFQLPDGASIAFDGKEITLTYTTAYVTPPALAALKVKWDVSPARAATAALLQVSRSAFGADLDPFDKPTGLVSETRYEGKLGSAPVSVGAIAKKLGYEVPADQGAPRRLSSPQRLAGPSAFMARGGYFSVFVRVVPIASVQNPVPVGKASQSLRICYSKPPPFGFKIEDTYTPNTDAYKPPPIQCISIKYTPAKYYCYVHPNSSVCSKAGKSKPWYEAIVSTFVDIWNFVSETYQAAKNKVIDVAASLLPMVPRDVFAYALDTALVACGMPPNIPNLDEMMEGGADYLAGEIVSQVGPPVAGDLAKDKIKQAILQGAKAAAKKVGNAGPDTLCQYTIDMPYMVMLIRNTSDKPIGNLKLSAMDDTSMFMSFTQTISVLKPGAAFPVLIPVIPNMTNKKYVDGGVVKDNYFWADYNASPDKFDIYATDKALGPLVPFGATTGKRMFNVPFEIKM